MMYVPILKNRQQELAAASELSYAFSNKVIPLFEIIKDIYETQYEIDALTGEYIYKIKNNRRYRIKSSPTAQDIRTLQYINTKISGARAFIDFFRFDPNKYKGFDIKQVQLSWALNGDFRQYQKRIEEISVFPNFIPVISIKQGFVMKPSELKVFLENLQTKCASVALRITDDLIRQYSNIIKNTVRNADYILLDIGEQPPKSKVMEFDEMRTLSPVASIILLNSPRKDIIRNGQYEDRNYTLQIDNSAKDKAQVFKFSGYGDYCGLTDSLPKDIRTSKGAALALIYNYEVNKFMSYVNPDTILGVEGYEKVISEICDDEALLNPNGNCPVINYITQLTTTSSRSMWKRLIIKRYIHQVYINI